MYNAKNSHVESMLNKEYFVIEKKQGRLPEIAATDSHNQN